jgi:hypothetical protein
MDVSRRWQEGGQRRFIFGVLAGVVALGGERHGSAAQRVTKPQCRRVRGAMDSAAQRLVDDFNIAYSILRAQAVIDRAGEIRRAAAESRR